MGTYVLHIQAERRERLPSYPVQCSIGVFLVCDVARACGAVLWLLKLEALQAFGGVAETVAGVGGIALAVCEPRIELPDLFNPAV
jgi:hypothetical protein